jgi:hypothetical protein
VTSIRKWFSIIALAAALAGVTARPAAAQAPAAPTNLTFLVNGSTVSLYWTHSTGTFTHYVIEAALAPGAPAFVTAETSFFVDPGKLPQMLSSVAFQGIGAGTYFVRVRGANGGQWSAPSNEVAITVGGCQVPAAPTEFTTIMRNGLVYMMWNPGSGHAPTAYDLIARENGNIVAVFPLGSTPYLNVGGVPPGFTFAVSVRARNACGASGESNVQQVNAAVNTPARTPNAGSGGRLPQPFVRDLVFQIGAEARARGLLDGSVSCPLRAGYSADDIEARKVNLNGYIDFMVGRLREVDQRFGYNAKTPRSGPPLNAIVAGDEIAYHYGPDASEGSPNVFIVDTLGGHCTFGRESVDYRPFYNEFGRWTGAGRFDQQEQQ